MEILLTGNTALVTQHWIQTAFPQEHVLLTTRQAGTSDAGVRTIVLDSKQRLEQLIDTYAFDRIVYFSEYLTPHSEQEGELDRLRRMLQANRERSTQLLYLAGPESVLTPPTGKTVLAQSAEQLCRHYARSSNIQIKILHLPYLYTAEKTAQSGGFASLFAQVQQGQLHFDEPEEQPVFALCMEDLAQLVARMFDSWTPESEAFTVPAAFALLHRELGGSLQKLCKDVQITYGTDQLRQYPPDDGIVRRRYGWFARYALRDDLPALWKNWQAAHPAPQKTQERQHLWLECYRRIWCVPEIAAAGLGMEALVRLTDTQAQFRMVDIRLLFVVLFSTVHGLNMGIFSAALAAVSLVLGYMRQGTAPILLFYEPTYWLGFLIYFVVGAVCGYVQRRNADTVRFANEECSLLRRQLQFIRQLYQDTLAEKRSLGRQLLGRRDSFGKIYAVTRRLDVTQPQLLYRNALQVMQDVLETQSLTLYRPAAEGTSARLAAASPACTQADRSLPEKVLRYLWPTLAKGELWVNRALLSGLPMYAAAARRSGEPVLLLLQWEAQEEQLTLYEENLFRILSGLVETALVRALDYEDAVRQTQYLPGTQLLCVEAFTRRLAGACALQEAKMAAYLLLRVHCTEWDAARLRARLQGVCRSGDAAGMAADHSLCLLLEQAGPEDLPQITRKLAAQGITVQQVPYEEQLRLAGARQEVRA